jgi:predicted DNA binding CopG/RHH family protein
LELDTREKERNNMKKKITYKHAPKNIAKAMQGSERINDFLPSPEELVKKEETVKITISLSKESVEFFKKNSKKMGVPYQTMIKSLLDSYTSHYNH